MKNKAVLAFKEDYIIIYVNDLCGGYTIIQGSETKRRKLVNNNTTPQEEAARFFGGEFLFSIDE